MNFKKLGLLLLVLLMASTAVFAQRGGTLGGTQTVNYTLRVNVNVTGAQIYLNNGLQTGTVFTLPAGTYSLRVTAPGYVDYTAQVALNANRTVNVTLQPSGYTLTVNPNVAGAEIYINNALQIGNILTLPAGSYALRVSAPGYVDFNAQVRLSSNQTINAVLQPVTYTLTIQTGLSSAEIFINNALQNTNRLVLGAGNYTVRVSAPGYRDYIQSIALTQNQVLNVNLVPINGFLTVELPNGIRDFRLSIGDQNYNRNQLEDISLSPGVHILRMDIGGLVGLLEVEIEADEELVIQPVLGFQVTDEDGTKQQ